MIDQEQLRTRLAALRVEHGDLDHAIACIADLPAADALALARMKKRKLALRDEIAWLEDQLLPDIIA